MCKKINLKNIFKTFYSSFLKKFACAQKVGFPRSGHICQWFQSILNTLNYKIL